MPLFHNVNQAPILDSIEFENQLLKHLQEYTYLFIAIQLHIPNLSKPTHFYEFYFL